ncbi:MAG TPA: outer membrane beta-barrel family protein, partial [Flavipsychrobacter sp.]|nr:outer membrane beta-barrel family protein [Flavipsychrobacter sp.]
DADYFTRFENDTRDFNTQAVFPNGAAVYVPAQNRTEAKQNIDIRSVKADILLPYEIAEISIGAKASSIHTISDNRFSVVRSEQYIADPLRSDRFDYEENTQAIYASLMKEWEKWETQFGLRVETTQTTGTSLAMSQTVRNNYFQLFPTAYVQYKPNDRNVFNINYSRRVGRPSYEELNPFRVYGTGSSYIAGNPFLRPSFYHTVELSYSLNSKYIFTAYTGIVNNIHARISRIDTANKTFFLTNDNAGTAINTGISATLMLNPFEWLESNIQLQYYYDKVNSDYYDAPATRNGVAAFDAQVTNSLRLNNDQTLLAEAGFMYSSGFQYDFFIRSPYSVLSAGIKALFLDKQLVLAINASDILRTEKYVYENIYNGLIQDSYFDARSLNISLNWKFGNKKIKAARQRETETDEIRRAE